MISYYKIRLWLKKGINIQCNFCTCSDNLVYLCKRLKIIEAKGEYLQKTYPHIKNFCDSTLVKYIHTMYTIGLPKETLLQQPTLFSIKPITIKYRYIVLKECGLNKITGEDIVKFFKIIRDTTIQHLKEANVLPKNLEIEKSLTNTMTQWPISHNLLTNADVNKHTLSLLRIKIIQRYLEFVVEITEKEFDDNLRRFPNIKYRPLSIIDETIILLLKEIEMPVSKIKSNFYVLFAHPENLKNYINKIKCIAGVDIKKILRSYPLLVNINYYNIIDIQNILKEFEVGSDVQIRSCFQIFQLSPATVRARLKIAKETPEFSVVYNHTRFLELILYNNKVLKRITNLSNDSKKCVSIETLCGVSANFNKLYTENGDCYRTGCDLIFFISVALGKRYTKANIHKIIKRHPFWLNIPLVQIKYVYDQLSPHFSAEDIYENCSILFYPWYKIEMVIKSLSGTTRKSLFSLSQESSFFMSTEERNMDFKSISKSKQLSLILYFIERKYSFSGDGVWADEVV